MGENELAWLLFTRPMALQEDSNLEKNWLNGTDKHMYSTDNYSGKEWIQSKLKSNNNLNKKNLPLIMLDTPSIWNST